MVEVSDIGLLHGDVLIPDLKTGVMADLLNDAGIKPSIRDWANNNSAAQLIKSKGMMTSGPAAEVEDSSLIASIIMVSSISMAVR